MLLCSSEPEFDSSDVSEVPALSSGTWETLDVSSAAEDSEEFEEERGKKSKQKQVAVQ